MTYQRKTRPALWTELPGASKTIIRNGKRLLTMRKRVRPVSARQSKRLRKYAKKRREFLAAHPYCMAAGPHFHEGKIVRFCKRKQGHKATQVHHVRGRLGPLLLDERYFAGVCDEAQLGIHSQLAAAKSAGLIQGPWNHQPK